MYKPVQKIIYLLSLFLFLGASLFSQPKAAHILFSSESGIVSYNQQNKSLTLLHKAVNANLHEVSSSGKYLMVSRKYFDSPRYIINRKGKVIYKFPENYVNAVFYTDRSCLVFKENVGILQINFVTKKENVIKKIKRKIWHDVQLKLSPDKQWISYYQRPGGMYLLNLTTKIKQSFGRRITFLHWHPSSQKILLFHKKKLKFHILSLKTKTKIFESNRKDIYGIWNKNGSRFVYVKFAKEKNIHLYSYNFKSKKPILVSKTIPFLEKSLYRLMDFHPDGDKIIFINKNNGFFQLVEADISSYPYKLTILAKIKNKSYLPKYVND